MAYTHDTFSPGEPLVEALRGSGTIDNWNEYVEDIFFGICTSGGTCVSHTGISEVEITVVLHGTGYIDKTLKIIWGGSIL
ncbi:MAG: hypothetical protein UW75_C0064G0006 [Parcubacteria group bacterium GW2011_GWF2_44_8]|nr:MAG: hypothetical protein UW75_C0064G0006 [Parcubacteria group bacterium GW2011_GWF2_44_8]